jgi:hypothetical protein
MNQMELLSPLAQYYLRKLLTEQNQASKAVKVDENLENVRSYRKVKRLNVQGLESSSCRELETLIHHYQSLENQIAHHYEGLNEVKRRIFWLLDHRISSSTAEEVPPLVLEQNVLRFSFLHQENLTQGIRFENEVYGLIREYPLDLSRQAFHMAWALIERAVPVTVTISDERYALWVSLRSPAYPILFNPSTKMCDRILALQTKLNSYYKYELC